VNKEKAKHFLDCMRNLAENKKLVKIPKDAAVLIVQTALFYFGCLNYVSLPYFYQINFILFWTF
jgi:hypothetical protein